MLVITGGSGNLGSALILRAHAKEVDFVAPSHSELDITDFASCYESLKGLSRDDVIIHSAAETNLDYCDENPAKCFAVNSVGTLNIAKIASKIGCFLIYISTDYVYDGAQRDLEHAEVDFPSNPCTVYGVSKLAAEDFVKMSGCRYLIARLGWLFGIDPRVDKKFVGMILRNAFKNECVNVVDDKIGTFTYAPNAADLLLNYAQIRQQGIRHLTNRGLVSRYTFTEELFKLWEIDTRLISCPSSFFPNLVRRPDFSGLRSIYPDANMPTWQEALGEFVEEYREVDLRPRTAEVIA